MHQRELKKARGPFGTVYEWQGHKARLTYYKGAGISILKEETAPYRTEKITNCPGWGAHGKAQSYLAKWWDTPRAEKKEG